MLSKLPLVHTVLLWAGSKPHFLFGGLFKFQPTYRLCHFRSLWSLSSVLQRVIWMTSQTACLLVLLVLATCSGVVRSEHLKLWNFIYIIICLRCKNYTWLLHRLIVPCWLLLALHIVYWCGIWGFLKCAVSLVTCSLLATYLIGMRVNCAVLTIKMYNVRPMALVYNSGYWFTFSVRQQMLSTFWRKVRFRL